MRLKDMTPIKEEAANPVGFAASIMAYIFNIRELPDDSRERKRDFRE